MATIHILHIPEKQARERAMKAFLGVRETWVSMRGNLFGVTTEHVQALEKEHIPFEYASKPPVNNAPAPSQL
jgi:hypothetical protein